MSRSGVDVMISAAAGALALSLERVLRILLPAQDILDGRVGDVDPPAWCERRGWVDFLLALSDDELRRCEAEGLGMRAPEINGAPADLVDLAIQVTTATRLPALRVLPRAPSPAALRAVSARKREQLASLLGAVGAMAERAARIVDVGAGSGHFTRIAAEMFDREALGIERNEGRVTAAVARAGECVQPIRPGAGVARFVALDACREALSLNGDDLAIGLHACGELGDRLVAAAGEARCDFALVSCCLQKIESPAREPLSRAGAGLSLRRDMLGLTNLTAQPLGVETTIDATMDARQARYALGRLLRERGVDVSPGEEMRGINRRRAYAGLRDIAERALAIRSLSPPTDAEIRRHEEESRLRYGAVRRLSLPRSMLARLVEVAVALDRAAALEESGQHVRVATLFNRAVTPRNIAVFASSAVERLPRAERGDELLAE
jgi:hypothetical protein